MKFIQTLKNIWKIEELKNRILVTLGLLLVYRFGAQVVLPGIDADQLGQFSGNFAGGGIGGLLDAFTGGAFSNASIFALGIMPYISASIVVQLMGIAEIGKQAQPFDSSVLDKIRIVHESFPEKMISIDGSVNPETIQKLAAAGANRFVAGSAIVGQPDEVLAYQKLAALVN